MFDLLISGVTKFGVKRPAPECREYIPGIQKNEQAL